MTPYDVALRAGGSILAIILVLGAIGYVSTLQDSLAYAKAAETRLKGQLETQQKNGKMALALAGRNADRERERVARVQQLEEEVRRARKPVPVACRGVLDPVVRALDGVRQLRGDGRPPAAGSVVPARPAPSKG